MTTPTIIACVAGGGLLLSLVLLSRSRAAGPLPGCGPGSACDAVLSSRWSRWLGLPVAVPAVCVYLALFTVSVLNLSSGQIEVRRAPRMAQAGLALLAGGAAAWFVAVQALVIGRFCAYCTAVHVLGIVVCVVTLSAWGLPSGMTAALAVAGLVALVAGQLLFRPREYVVRSTLPPPAVPGPARPAIKSMEDSPPPSDRRGSRQVEVLGGRVVLTVGDWPRLGPADAPHVIAYLFDYTCATCRNVHRLLLEAIPMSGLDIAVLLVPAPVDPTCNPHVIRRSVTHAHACRYARLGLMVWRANSDRFAEYDRWVFDGGDEPPAIGFARARAEELLGMTDLDPSVPDGDLEQLIAKGVATYRTADSGKMPTLLFPNAVLSGQVPSAERLAEILREQFASP